ncbi:MAG: sensor histidine kinase, partial [Solirubrobacteraceae bacterium]
MSVASAPAPDRVADTPRRAPLVRDTIVALTAFGLTIAMLHGAHGGFAPRVAHPRGLDVLGVLLAVIACFSLLAHRRAPLGAFVVSAAASAAINVLGFPLGPPFGATAALFYLAADARTRDRLPRTPLVVLIMTAVHVAATALSETGFPTTPILGAIVLWGGAWIVGVHVAQRRQRRADLAERAARTQHDVERESRLAVAEERTRIARDLHDSAAHAINVILVQAGGARLLQHSDPDAVRGALQTIEDVARETITDIDRLIRGLREERSEPADTVEPPAGLAALPTIAERHRAAGLEVHIEVHGPSWPLAPGLDQAAFRILQESLTNAARHGIGAAQVKLSYAPGALELTVSNPRAPTRDGEEHALSGHGLQGMRERAALLGGSLAISHPSGRFTVRATLPYA